MSPSLTKRRLGAAAAAMAAALTTAVLPGGAAAASQTGAGGSSWTENVSHLGAGDVNVVWTGEALQVRDGKAHSASAHDTRGSGSQTLPEHRLPAPANQITVTLAATERRLHRHPRADRALRGLGRLDHIWQNAPNAAWSAWARLGGGGYRIAAGANADGRIEVFASSNAGVFHCWQTAPNSPFSDWSGVGGPANSRLQMERSADGRLEVFALSDTAFSHLYQTAPTAAGRRGRTSAVAVTD